ADLAVPVGRDRAVPVALRMASTASRRRFRTLRTRSNRALAALPELVAPTSLSGQRQAAPSDHPAVFIKSPSAAAFPLLRPVHPDTASAGTRLRRLRVPPARGAPA